MGNIKNKKVKLIGFALAGTIGITSLGCYIYDRTSVNHLSEECPFNKILSSSHQVNYINKNYESLGFEARKIELIKTGVHKYIREVAATTKDDGTVVINVPDGYYYDKVSYEFVKTVRTHEPVLDANGNEIKEKYILIGDAHYLDADYKYDYECDENSNVKLIKLS